MTNTLSNDPRGAILNHKLTVLESTYNNDRRLLFQVEERSKRSFFVLGLIASTLSFGIGALLTSRSQGHSDYILHEHASAINRNSLEIIKLRNELKDTYSWWEKIYVYDLMIQEIDVWTLHLSKAQHALEEALQGRLSPVTVNGTILQQDLNQLQKKIAKDGYQSLPNLNYHDIFNLPTSVIYEKGKVIWILHLPIYRNGKLLDLFRYQRFPWTKYMKSENILFYPDPPNEESFKIIQIIFIDPVKESNHRFYFILLAK